MTAPHHARVRVRGLVQGVGFRPFVATLAERLRVAGWVRNDGEGVVLEADGGTGGLDRFLAALVAEAPPLARVDAVEVAPLDGGRPGGGFAIIDSDRGQAVTTTIPPDAAPCRACLGELFDPRDRRYLYPFLNCTHCGPRWTITRGLPYDRPYTSMAGFAMCADCAREYHDPRDRRYHAQPVACPACGPHLSHDLATVVAALRAGSVVAVQGLGGFHLACDARDPAAVARLRARKDRDAKPFAVMVLDPASAARIVELDPVEGQLLASIRRPVVLAARRDDRLAPAVAPDLSTLGVMLPSAPLHYLMFHEAAGSPAGTAWLDAPHPLVLVMTSANPGGEPLVIDPDEAHRRLAGIADLIVTHDRPIVVRTDDSVVRVVAGAASLVRRARGWVPDGVRLPGRVAPVVAVGGDLKNAPCMTRGELAFLGQHVGDLDDPATLGFLDEVVAHLRRVLKVDPVAVAHDLHPDFASTRVALALGLPAVAVQHHHAHAAAVLAEHRITDPALAVVLDGYGLGSDGQAWGGELLIVEGTGFERWGHLAPLALPGGDAAAREPWRMAAAFLHRAGRGAEIADRFADQPLAAGVAQLLARGVRTPPTTSCGRWFDAAAGLLGVRATTSYEGEAAMVLESLCRAPEVVAGGFELAGHVLDPSPVVAGLDPARPGPGAERFHGTLAAGLVAWAARAARDTGLTTVALGGGCLVNRFLTEAVVAGLSARGLTPLVARAVPPGDGGLALGQAWIAARIVGGA